MDEAVVLEPVETTEPTVAEPVSTPEPTVSDWKASLPEDLRNDKTIGQVKSVEDMAKMTVDTLRKMGAKRTEIPGENATDEQWSNFYKEVGVPGNADDYNLKAREKKSESELSVPDELIKEYSQFAHKTNLTTRQANAMLGFYEELNERATGQLGQSLDESKAKAVAELQKEYGNAYESKLELAKGAVLAVGGQELVSELEESGWGNRPAMIKAMVKVGAMIGEDRIIGQNQAISSFTPSEGAAEVARLQSDQGFMKQYMSSADPMHKQAVQTMRQAQLNATGAENKVITSQQEVSSS